MTFINSLINLHHSVFGAIERMTASWLPSLAARFVFAGVLALYFWNSAWGKLGEGVFGFLNLNDGAYFSTLGEGVMLAYDIEVANIPWYYDIIVYLGTWAEFILPAMLVLGLFTRIAAAGMAIFVAVQTYVDVAVHKVGPETIGALFDRHSDSAIMDQRAWWYLGFLVLIVLGGGAVSLDRLLTKWWNGNNT